MWTPIIVVCVILAVLAVAAPKVLKDLGFLGKAEIGKVGRWAANADPQAQLDQLVDKGLDNIAKAKSDLEAEKELVISCQRRADQNTEEEARLTNRIKTAMSNGDPNGTCKEYALSLAHVREQLASNNEQLAKHKANYEAFAKKVEIGQRQVLDAKQKAKELGVALQESDREAKLSRFAEDFSVGDVTGSMGDAMSKLQERIDANKAKSEVANEMNKQSLAEAKDDELEQQAKADAILAEFGKK
jgi:phage shock protein A